MISSYLTYMNQTLPTHPLISPSTKLASNKSGDVFPKRQTNALSQAINADTPKPRADKSRQDTDNPDTENEFAAALLVLSPLESIKNTATAKNIANIQSGIVLSGQALADNGNTPLAETKITANNLRHATARNPETGQIIQGLDVQTLTEIHADKNTQIDSAALAAQARTKNAQGIDPNTITAKIAAVMTVPPAPNTAGQIGNAQTNPEIQANPELATLKTTELNLAVRATRSAQDKIQNKMQNKIAAELSSVQMSTAAHADTHSDKTAIINLAQSQAIITQLGDAVALQTGKAISGSILESTAGTATPIQTALGQTKSGQTKSGQPPGPISVQLSPAELGRVHIQFSFDAADKIIAHIIAENAETGALLKRNSDLLTTHLKLGGFDNIDLNFETKPEKSFLDFTQNNSKNGTNMFANTDGQPGNKPGNESGNEFGQTTDHDTPNIGQQVLAPIMRPLATPNMDQLDISI